ncbi:hypothetical protein [Candidatus Kuenenia stuttgartiensis]|uniref:hypothetical protein n=1 Tax=Kuenenia stuttgartiensis TaxID=174633 RepID=UPI00146DF744|nr:hypothetical protein [Candidatus Kuenenia stuttgartiensis]
MMIYFKKRIPAFKLSEETEGLVNHTNDYRKKSAAELNELEKYFIKRLNRLLIEAAYPAHSPNIKVTRLTKDLENDYFIYLSDTSWNQYKYVISNKDIKISKAYMLIGEINASSKASVHADKEKTLPRLAQAIIKAKDAIDEAIA